MPETLEQAKAWLKLQDCTCRWEYGSFGRLYGISMGKGWQRLDDAAGCPEHGEEGSRP